VRPSLAKSPSSSEVPQCGLFIYEGIEIQHVYRTSWYFKNHSQLAMDSSNLDFQNKKGRTISGPAFQVM
jgi:hypothetical protein